MDQSFQDKLKLMQQGMAEQGMQADPPVVPEDPGLFMNLVNAMKSTREPTPTPALPLDESAANFFRRMQRR